MPEYQHCYLQGGVPHDILKSYAVAFALEQGWTAEQTFDNCPLLGLDLKSIKALMKRIEKNGGSAIPGLYGCHDNHKRLVQRAHAVYLHLKTLVDGSSLNCYFCWNQ